MTKKRVRKVARSLLLAILSLPFLGAMLFTALAGLAWLEDQGVSVVGYDGSGRPICVTPVEVQTGDSLAKIQHKLDARKIDYLVDAETAQMIARTAISWWPATATPTTLMRIHFDANQRVQSIEQSPTHQGL